ncbi:GDSL-like Lipase/Acylhydrolase-domain-containing protein [Gongronella butleri]|nr:GDSL-like Lipase/Acylhydrolase-domain-containing protein [Gongronella butleri]
MYSPFLSFLLLPLGAMAISNLVVFGDSYSDVGNFQRWTNGPVWSEHVAAAWNASLHSFAYSGAVCDNALYPNNTSIYYTTPSIMDQVEFYYTQHLNMDPSDTVYAFWVGVNDVHQMFKENPEMPPLESISACIAYQIETVHRLFNANQILLMNLPPMEKMPYFLNTLAADERRDAVITINKQLHQHVDALNSNYPRLSLDYIDVHSLLNDVIADPEPFGFVNTDGAYWDNCENYCNEKNMDQYVWWDRTHLTGGVHHVLGNSVLQAGSYAPSTTIPKKQTEKLLLKSESEIRSPIYRAVPHTGLILDMWEEMDDASQVIVPPKAPVMDQGMVPHQWMAMIVLITFGTIAALFFWRSMRRKQLQRHDYQVMKSEA